MITLATLHEATEQEVFDQVALHLLNQGERSNDVDGSICMYKGAGGLQCAAGCLISDEEYSNTLEGSDWDMLVMQNRIPNHHRKLIGALQAIHDSQKISDWVPSLTELADEFKLDITDQVRKAMQVYTEERDDGY